MALPHWPPVVQVIPVFSATRVFQWFQAAGAGTRPHSFPHIFSSTSLVSKSIVLDHFWTSVLSLDSGLLLGLIVLD